MAAEILIRRRVVFEDGAVAEMVVWRLPRPVPPSRHGFKYRMAYVVDGRRVLGYDNERGKGDHRHLGAREEPYEFVSIDALIGQFVSDIEAIRRTDDAEES